MLCTLPVPLLCKRPTITFCRSRLRKGVRLCVQAASSTNPEVEIKLRLPSKEAHDKVAAALAHAHKAFHAQENFFFDGTNNELSKAHLTVRTRFYNVNQQAVITVKGRQALVDGIGRATEEEIDVDPIHARTFLEHPDSLLAYDDPLIQKLKETTGVKQLVCLGGFKNNRDDFAYEGFKLELDETMFEWGTVYEIEVETAEPEKLKEKLEGFLRQHGIPFTYSKSTKFGNFRNRTLK